MERILLVASSLLGALLLQTSCQRDAASESGECGDGVCGTREGCRSCAADCACTGGGEACGDGVAADPEACDTEDLADSTCATLGYTGGELRCTAACVYDVSGCAGEPEPRCGDGQRGELEQCDGADLGGVTCATVGFGAGELSCSSACRLVTTGCTGDPPATDLDAALGCEGVYNPEQVLDYHLEGDWNRVLTQPSDGTATEPVPFELSCGDAGPVLVGVTRKRGGGSEKVGFKIDLNEYVTGQSHFGLAKLVFDNSVGCCDPDDSLVGDLVREYLAWRIMALSGAISGRAVFANVHVNGALLGVMLNVEAVDKRFLLDRFGDNSGWLYKHSGGDGDGLKTNESCTETTCPNPYSDYFCFWPVSGRGCSAPPADVATSLPERLMLDQMLRVGAVNALVANSDGPILKDNNYYVYDWPGGRAYLPWDLDTTMKEAGYDVFAGGDSAFRSVLFPAWEADYDTLLTDLVRGPLTESVIHGELERALRVAALSVEADPYASESLADLVAELDAWWAARHAAVVSQVEAH